MLVNNEKDLEESICKENDLNSILKEFVNTNAKLLCIMNFEVKNKRRQKLEQELEKAKNELEREVNSGNFDENKIYELSSKIDELIIQKYTEEIKEDRKCKN